MYLLLIMTTTVAPTRTETLTQSNTVTMHTVTDTVTESIPTRTVSTSLPTTTETASVSGTLSLRSISQTVSPTGTVSETYTVTPKVASATCLGDNFHPKHAPATSNFTLTIYCRHEIVGEYIFITKTLGECYLQDNVMLVDPLPSTHTTMGHPVYQIPPINEAGSYQICLQDLQGMLFPIPGVLTLRRPDAKPFVWLDRQPDGVKLTVEGFDLTGVWLAVSVDKYCGRNVIATNEVHPAADMYGGGYVVKDGGRYATTHSTVLTPGNRYWSCIKLWEDDVYTPHASFFMEKITLERSTTSPPTPSPNEAFSLTLFGVGLLNTTGYPCRVSLVKYGVKSCTYDGQVADDVTTLDDTVICRFHTGVTLPGWYYACLGGYNSSAKFTEERGYGVEGGAVFEVVEENHPAGGWVVPTVVETKSWFNVIIENSNGGYVRVGDDHSCEGVGNLTGRHNEVEAHQWTGGLIFSTSNNPLVDHSYGAVTFPKIHGNHTDALRYHMVNVSEVHDNKSHYLVICERPTNSSTASLISVGSSGMLRVVSPSDCDVLHGRYDAASRSCEIDFCRGVASGYTVMGLGLCLNFKIARVGVRTEIAVTCHRLRGKYNDNLCWMDLCKIGELPPPKTDLSVSEPMFIHRPTFPAHICYRPRHIEPKNWKWIAGFEAREPCKLKIAKYCRWITCGDELTNPGPCMLLSPPTCDNSSRCQVNYDRSSQEGIQWNGAIQGTSKFLQKFCRETICKVGGNMMVYFEDSLEYRHRAAAIGRSGMEMRYLTFRPGEVGEEIYTLTNELPLDPTSEVTVGFTVHGAAGYIVHLGLVSNETAFTNSTATPLRYSTTLNGTTCSGLLSPGNPYRLFFRLTPPEIPLYLDTTPLPTTPLCYLHHPTSFEPFTATGWRLAFMFVVPNSLADRPVSNEAKVELRA